MGLSELVDRAWQSVEEAFPGGTATTVVDAPDGTDLAELVAEVGRRAGRPRNLAAGGFTDPSLTERTGRPLVEPFGRELLEMRGWAHKSRWIGCGRLTGPAGLRTVIVVAPREDPATAGFPPGSSWAERLCILTGSQPVSGPPVDWSAAEAALGTRLPADYKEIVDLFGEGGFDDYLDLLVPGAFGSDLVQWSRGDAEHADMWRPYAVHPAPDGLLRWGTSEQEVDFFWQTGAGDPDGWTVLAQPDFDVWERFGCGVGEFVLRMLTDLQFGFPTSGLTAHYFRSSAG